MKKILLALCIGLFAISCGSKPQPKFEDSPECMMIKASIKLWENKADSLLAVITTKKTWAAGEFDKTTFLREYCNGEVEKLNHELKDAELLFYTKHAAKK